MRQRQVSRTCVILWPRCMPLKDLGIPFDQLKAKLTGPGSGKSAQGDRWLLHPQSTPRPPRRRRRRKRRQTCTAQRGQRCPLRGGQAASATTRAHTHDNADAWRRQTQNRRKGHERDLKGLVTVGRAALSGAAIFLARQALTGCGFQHARRRGFGTDQSFRRDYKVCSRANCPESTACGIPSV